ncbi:hypothetical protein NOVO_03295 [Rickettsiales bacterium Ac37b]|nr:hypothetical protein NOVO_03295 [Rickettsiales bacterium Ac37b]
MSDKVCDVSNVMKVFGTSVYKTLILDNVPNRVVSLLTNNLLREDGLILEEL